MRTVLCVLLLVAACEPDGFTPPSTRPPEPELPGDLELVALSEDGLHALMRPTVPPDGLYHYVVVEVETNRIERSLSFALDSKDLRGQVDDLVRDLGPFHLNDPSFGLAIAPDRSYIALAGGHTLYVASRNHDTVNLDVTGAFRPMVSEDSSVLFALEISGEFAPSGEPLEHLVAIRREGEAAVVTDSLGATMFMATTPSALRAVQRDPVDRHPCFIEIPYATLVPRRLTCDFGNVDRCVFSPSARWVACAMTNTISVRALAIDLESASPPYERVIGDVDQLSAINDRGDLVIRSAPGLFRNDDELVVRTRKGLRVEPPR